MMVITVVDSLKLPGKKINKGTKKTKQEEKYEEASQKTITISGEVRDVQATPIAQVKVKATKLDKESVTNSRGVYIIEAFSNDILIFSAPDYEESTIRVGNQRSINIQLNNSHD